MKEILNLHTSYTNDGLNKKCLFHCNDMGQEH